MFRGAPLGGGGGLSRGNAMVHQDLHPPRRRIPDARCPPRDSRGAPQNACHPEAQAWAGITCFATAVRRVSESRRRDVMLARATRNGPGWGSTSPQHSSRRGGAVTSATHRSGGRGGATVAPAGGGGTGGSTRPTRELNCCRSNGVKGGVKGGATTHACRSTIALGPDGPAAPRSGGRRRSPAQGGRAKRRGRQCGRRHRSASGRRQGGGGG